MLEEWKASSTAAGVDHQTPSSSGITGNGGVGRGMCDIVLLSSLLCATFPHLLSPLAHNDRVRMSSARTHTSATKDAEEGAS